MPEFCTVETDGHVLMVTINRPDRMNSLHGPPVQEAAAKLEQLHDQGPTTNALDFKTPFDDNGNPWRMDRDNIRVRAKVAGITTFLPWFSWMNARLFQYQAGIISHRMWPFAPMIWSPMISAQWWMIVGAIVLGPIS